MDIISCEDEKQPWEAAYTVNTRPSSGTVFSFGRIPHPGSKGEKREWSCLPTIISRNPDGESVLPVSAPLGSPSVEDLKEGNLPGDKAGVPLNFGL